MKTKQNNESLWRWYVVAVMAIIVFQLLLILVSWIITSANPDTPMRSLLSSEGIRWLVGHLSENLANKTGVWLFMLAVAYGVAKKSHIGEVFSWHRKWSYRQKFAFRITLLEVVLVVIILLYLTLTPHALLLGVTGSLSSSFWYGLVPILLTCVTVFAVTYGMFSRSFGNLNDAFDAMCDGVKVFAPLLILFLLLSELYFSLVYVFSAV